MPAKNLNLPNIKVDEEVDEEVNREVYKEKNFFSLLVEVISSYSYHMIMLHKRDSFVKLNFYF
jgi:hypothetical protein